MSGPTWTERAILLYCASQEAIEGAEMWRGSARGSYWRGYVNCRTGTDVPPLCRSGRYAYHAGFAAAQRDQGFAP